jgi:hypothetical protein
MNSESEIIDIFGVPIVGSHNEMIFCYCSCCADVFVDVYDTEQQTPEGYMLQLNNRAVLKYQNYLNMIKALSEVKPSDTDQSPRLVYSFDPKFFEIYAYNDKLIFATTRALEEDKKVVHLNPTITVPIKMSLLPEILNLSQSHLFKMGTIWKNK